ncbi:darcynin [Actinomadura graeca]|uniref:Darcynin n=2 Tax=Actinomadura graeca TaxID=2750812 RepID=A0ABX8R5B9_9ACTN|nr:darcynin family protein [Actinomadura graeca]QXJ26249.1 darcynin [Actinomadura graeca]
MVAVADIAATAAGLLLDRSWTGVGSVPVIEARTRGVRSRFYDTEPYSARITDIWVWEADDHDAYRLLIDALRETPFWDRYFTVVALLVGTENGYARTYDLDPVATLAT